MNQKQSHVIEKEIVLKTESSTEKNEVFDGNIYENLDNNYEDKSYD